VQGSDEYVLREFGGDGDGALIESGPGHRRFYAHAYRAVDLKPGGPDQEIDIALRRGTALRGRVVGPDGRPVPDALVFSRIVLQTPRGADGNRSGSRRPAAAGARCATAASPCTGSMPTSRSPPSSSSPSGSSAPPSGSR